MVPIKTKKSKAERQKREKEKAIYLGNMSNKMLDAIEDVFDKGTPPPTGGDMIDIISHIRFLVFKANRNELQKQKDYAVSTEKYNMGFEK